MMGWIIVGLVVVVMAVVVLVLKGASDEWPGTGGQP